MIASRIPVDPIACDCCGKPLLPVFGTYSRVEREYGWASLPYVLCGSCALDHRGRPPEARVREWVLARASRAGQGWFQAVRSIVGAQSQSERDGR
ncbi:hypothetical protein DBR34_04795 [Stenotrophomonas sp. HMWF003]|nr:hypothetical protein DBR34_04795 [Stenotrophomonas sp. HMWF003]